MKTIKEISVGLEIPDEELTESEIQTALSVLDAISEGVWNQSLEAWRVRAIVKFAAVIYNHWEDEPSEQEPKDAFEVLRDAFQIIKGGIDE